jgi:signal transduction histidine kinase
VRIADVKADQRQHELALLVRVRAFFPGLFPIAAFLLTVVIAIYGAGQPGTLGLVGEPCGQRLCVGNVFPAGVGWSDGVRKGYLISQIDGADVSDASAPVSWGTIQSLVVIDHHGQPLTSVVSPQAISQSPLKWSLWLVAGFFGVLGSLVWYRRPDLQSAATLGRMAAVAAIALAIAPASGGPQLGWALSIQFTSIAVLAFTFYDFVYHLIGEHTRPGKIAYVMRRGLAGLTLALLIMYLLAVWLSAVSYELIQPLWASSFAAALLSSVYLLLAAVLRAPGGSDSDRLRVPLLGMVLGATPFPLATMVPLALGNDPLAPHLAVLPVILIPSAFAYSILHDQLWGIRRLIHRGLVYGLISAAVFGFVVSGMTLVNGMFSDRDRAAGEMFAVALVALLGVLAYSPISRGARWVIDRLIYGTTLSYPEFVHGLQRNLASADPERELPDTLNHLLADHLDLESALLFKHDDEAGDLNLLSAVGENTSRVLGALNDRRVVLPTGDNPDSPIVIPFEGEQLLAMPLWAAQQHVGTIVLGPKKGGELFIQDEVNLIANSAPFLGAALERHEMSQTMRQLNKRLIETDEHSRQRMAVDLHDGPLQKAVALAIGRVTDPSEQAEVAKELVDELRELGTRLRPSILDNLGLLSLDWLLEHNMRGTDIQGVLDIDLEDPSERFHPDIELALFRVTQEAINNAVKHSSATELRVHLERNEEQLVLTIKDNGVGIGGAGSGRIPSSRLGMIGMRERVLQVGGHLEVHSWPNRGVFIQATVPAVPAPQESLTKTEA